jgi:uncharacterized protein (DUF952 family)
MIYHIATEVDWQNCIKGDLYAPGRFNTDGFIHCSTKNQIERIANSIFRAYSKVRLIFVDDEKEKEFIVYENLEGGKEVFPHIYRKLPQDSIVKTVLLEKSVNEDFVMPF